MFGLATNFPVEFRRLVFVLMLEVEESHKIHAASQAQWDVLAKDKMTISEWQGRERSLWQLWAGFMESGVFLNHSPWGLAGPHTTSNWSWAIKIPAQVQCLVPDLVLSVLGARTFGHPVIGWEAFDNTWCCVLPSPPPLPIAHTAWCSNFQLHILFCL